MRNTHFISGYTNAQYALRNPHLIQTIGRMKTGEVIRKLRQQRELTIAEVESRAGLSDGNLSRIERCEQWLSEEKLFALAKALGVHPSELFPMPSAAKADDGGKKQDASQHLTPLLSHDYISAKEMVEMIDLYAKSDKTYRDMAMDALRSGAEKAAVRSGRTAKKKS